MRLLVSTDAALALSLGVSRQAVELAAREHRIRRDPDGWDVLAVLEQWRRGTSSTHQRLPTGHVLNARVPLSPVLVADLIATAKAQGGAEVPDREVPMEDDPTGEFFEVAFPPDADLRTALELFWDAWADSLARYYGLDAEALREEAAMQVGRFFGMRNNQAVDQIMDGREEINGSATEWVRREPHEVRDPEHALRYLALYEPTVRDWLAWPERVAPRLAEGLGVDPDRLAAALAREVGMVVAEHVEAEFARCLARRHDVALGE